MNLIYLGLITERIPILPMFTPSHIGGSVPPIDFGEVFDMSRLRSGLKKPVLEWHQVKDRNSTEIDELGCWNVWEAVQEREAFPRNSFVPVHLKLGQSRCARQWSRPSFISHRYIIYQSSKLDQGDS